MDLWGDTVAKDFIKELIVLDPEQRLTCDAAFQHPVSASLPRTGLK